MYCAIMDKKKDFAVTAFHVVEQVIEKTEKNPHAVALGKLGGAKGGKARAANMTPEQRSEIARNAARKRWGKKP